MANSISTTEKFFLEKSPSLNDRKTKSIYIATSHWISLIKPISLMIISGIGILSFFLMNGWYRYIIGIIFLIVFISAINSYIYYKTFKIVLINRQLSISAGWMSHHQLDIPIYRREGVFVSQSIFGRIFNYGRITISTGGVAATHTISKPNELRQELYKQLI